jgi:hypothetical protein
MNSTQLIKSLIQNYDFKKSKKGKIPTIDYVYPDYTSDGNTEAFRFSSSLRDELRERASIVISDLKGKEVLWTNNEPLLLEVGNIAPRLGLEEQIIGNLNSIYNYAPLLFIGESSEQRSAYVVKPLINISMAWFELTSGEKGEVWAMLERKAEDKPYRNLMQKVLFGFGRGR